MSAAKLLVTALLLCGAAFAHVGSPDVFLEGAAGSHRLMVAIRPPDVIPGIARIEVRALDAGVRKVELTPTPMTGEAAKHPPVADAASPAAADPQYFQGAVWLMSPGAWEVRVRVEGTGDNGELIVPVPAVALRTKPMDTGVGYFLFGMMVFLTVGLVAIVGAGAREAQLAPGAESPRWNRRTLTRMALAALVLTAVLWAGRSWWGVDAATYSDKIYKPLDISASLDSGSRLNLRLTDPGWLLMRKLDDLIPDHGHIMHFFLIRWPDMDTMFHLHPDQTAAGAFSTALPSLPSGNYRLYADIVHESGFAETAVGEVRLPEVKGSPLTGDDAGTVGVPPSGAYRIVWVNDPAKPIIARQLTSFSFAMAGPGGKPVTDLEPYMGMGGHAEFIKTDGSVFAHVHPTGTVSMASMEVASHAQMMNMHKGPIGSQVTFPYGVPTAGNYRVFVQMKHAVPQSAGKGETGVETGAFDFTAR